MGTALTIIIAILAFCSIITIHEFGHFFVAKLCGIQVNEFSIGMGPLLFKWGKGETQYSLRLLPIGGYCAMEGEEQASDNPRAYNKKAVWQRFLVVGAGAFMNIVLGFVIMFAAGCFEPLIGTTIVAKFDDDATSVQSGLMQDDEIVEINGRHIFVASDINYELTNDEDGIFEFKVIRNGERVTLPEVKFALDTSEGEKPSIKLDFFLYGKEKTITNLFSNAYKQTVSAGRLVYLSLFDLLSGKYGINDMSGPIGVVTVMKQAASIGVSVLLYIIALISINIGLFNVLPFPALDGGTLVLLIVEGIRRKPIPEKYETAVKLVGFALLIGLMLVVSANDIIKIIRG